MSYPPITTAAQKKVQQHELDSTEISLRDKVDVVTRACIKSSPLMSSPRRLADIFDIQSDVAIQLVKKYERDYSSYDFIAEVLNAHVETYKTVTCKQVILILRRHQFIQVAEDIEKELIAIVSPLQ